jgi:hypothetical protein
MRSFMFNAQLTMLWYNSTNWLAGLNLTIPLMRKSFRLTDFWVTLYFTVWKQRNCFHSGTESFFSCRILASMITSLLSCLVYQRLQYHVCRGIKDTLRSSASRLFNFKQTTEGRTSWAILICISWLIMIWPGQFRLWNTHIWLFLLATKDKENIFISLNKL